MKPVLCNYYVTYRCNARCGFCDIWEQPSPMVGLEDAERNLNDLKRLGVRIVDFTGGEPLLHPKIAHLLRKAKECGMMTTLTTNGLLYPKRADEIAGKVDMLHFSIDSSRADEHDASRGVRSFDRLMAAIELALELGERPDLLFTVTNSNIHRLEEIYREISYPNRMILIINPLFEYNSLGSELSADVLDEIEAFAKRPYTYLNAAFLTLRRRGGNDPDNPTCKAVSTCVVISPFNELVLPCYHYGMERIPIEGRLYDLWNSDTVKGHQAMEGRHEVCRGCTINCYFEPSFATTPGSRYFWESLPSKVRYSWTKFVLQRLEGERIFPPRPHPNPPSRTPSMR
jgi:MoaA/NifB/PqqE/SkfB family radical SAM enzyme